MNYQISFIHKMTTIIEDDVFIALRDIIANEKYPIGVFL
jgi:hypothetical protein